MQAFSSPRTVAQNPTNGDDGKELFSNKVENLLDRQVFRASAQRASNEALASSDGPSANGDF